MGYVKTAFWYGELGLLPALGVLLGWNLVLGLTGKRDFRRPKDLPWGRMAAELAFSVYALAVLSITGMLGLSLPEGSLLDNMGQIYLVPFLGASLKMLGLNLLLFVPYGFLLPLVLSGIAWTWKRALLTGFLTTLTIETLQLFTGRMFEVDDLLMNTAGTLAGYALVTSLRSLRDPARRRRSLGTLALALCVPALGLFLTSFFANADRIQAAELEAYFAQLETEETSITGEGFYGPDGVFHLLAADQDNGWETVREDLGNGAALYRSGPASTVVSEVVRQVPGLYYQVTFSPAVDIPLENAPDWQIEHITCLLYRLTDGAVWYGTGDRLTGCGIYGDREHPFQPDGDLYGAALAAVGN